MTLDSLERRISIRLGDIAPTPRWELLDQVIQAVDTTPQRRRGPWWPEMLSLPRRRDLPNALVLLLVAVALALGGLLALTLGRRPPAPTQSIEIRANSLPVPPGAQATDVLVNGLVQFRGLLVAVGGAVGADETVSADDTGLIWRSTDGHAWLAASDPSMSGSLLTGIATDGAKLVSVGQRVGAETRATAWISTDGVRWRAVNPDVPTFAGPIAFAYGRFFAAGCHRIVLTPCDVYSSPDGEHWVREATGGTNIRSIRATSNGLYVVGGGANAKATDPPFSLLYDGSRWQRAVPDADIADFGIEDVVQQGDGVVGIGIYDARTPTFGSGFWYARPTGASWQPVSFIGDFYAVHGVWAVPGAGNVVAIEGGGTEPIPMRLEGNLLARVAPEPGGTSASGVSTSAVIRMTDGAILVIGRAAARDGSGPTAWHLTGPGL